MKKIMRSPVMTALLFVLATVMLFAGTIGGTQAVFADTSSDYLSQLSMKHIGVALYENGGWVGERTYDNDTHGGDTSTGESKGWVVNKHDGPLVMNNLKQKGAETGDKLIKIGKTYPFEITASNTGTIPHYLRMVVYRYWIDENGNKIIDTQYDPKMIETAFGTDDYNSQYWYEEPQTPEEKLLHPERSIYYYRTILPVGQTTEPLYDKLNISTDIKNFVTINNNKQYEYFYNGKQFEVYVEVDAVQTHHAQDAWRSAWGVPGEILTTLGIPND